jgi:flagellar basal-body rod protein FlgC
MSFLNSLSIPGSALTAERFRMDLIAQNLANINTTQDADGEPYRRKQAVFQERALSFRQTLDRETVNASHGGVRVSQIVESSEPFTPVYDPSHPDADENGYVMMPNVDSAEEQVDFMAASRAYEANIPSLNIIKAMAMKALEIGK